MNLPKCLLSLFIILILSITLMPVAVFAKSVGDIDDFRGLSGNGKYLNKEYRDNYSLDIEETGILDTGDEMMNNITNSFFGIVESLAYMVVTIFYRAMTFDIGELFSAQIGGIQDALHNSIFGTLFMLAFAASAYAVAIKFTKRDLMGILGDFSKVLLIVMLSTFVIRHSSTVLSATTSITKSLSVSALMSINDTGNINTASYSAEAAGMLWSNLVHEPWKSLEFNENDVGTSTVEAFLSTAPGSEDRAELVKEYIEEQPEDDMTFSKKISGQRISLIAVYSIPFFIKSFIFIVVAILQLAFQIMAVFYVLLAPIILILAMIPAFGGLEMISSWLKKILETQLSILIITFLIGMLIKLDQLLFALAGTWGWAIVIILETVISLVIAFSHQKIFKGLSNMSRSMRNPSAAKHYLRNGGNVFGALGSNAYNLKAQRQRFTRGVMNAYSGTKKLTTSMGKTYTKMGKEIGSAGQEMIADIKDTPKVISGGIQRVRKTAGDARDKIGKFYPSTSPHTYDKQENGNSPDNEKDLAQSNKASQGQKSVQSTGLDINQDPGRHRKKIRLEQPYASQSAQLRRETRSIPTADSGVQAAVGSPAMLSTAASPNRERQEAADQPAAAKVIPLYDYSGNTSPASGDVGRSRLQKRGYRDAAKEQPSAKPRTTANALEREQLPADAVERVQNPKRPSTRIQREMPAVVTIAEARKMRGADNPVKVKPEIAPAGNLNRVHMVDSQPLENNVRPISNSKVNSGRVGGNIPNPEEKPSTGANTSPKIEKEAKRDAAVPVEVLAVPSKDGITENREGTVRPKVSPKSDLDERDAAAKVGEKAGSGASESSKGQASDRKGSKAYHASKDAGAKSAQSIRSVISVEAHGSAAHEKAELPSTQPTRKPRKSSNSAAEAPAKAGDKKETSVKKPVEGLREVDQKKEATKRMPKAKKENGAAPKTTNDSQAAKSTKTGKAVQPATNASTETKAEAVRAVRTVRTQSSKDATAVTGNQGKSARQQQLRQDVQLSARRAVER